MDSGITAREPQQNYHAALLYLDLGAYTGKALHVRTNTGSHHFAAQLWEGHVSSDEHAWWINHPMIVSNPYQVLSPSLDWIVKPGFYTLLFFHDPIADRCNTRQFEIQSRIWVDTDTRTVSASAYPSTAQEYAKLFVTDSLDVNYRAGPPISNLMHIPGARQMLYLVVNRYGVPIHGRPLEVSLYRDGTPIATRTGMIEQDSEGISFPIEDEFTQGSYVARLSVDGRPLSEYSFTVQEEQAYKDQNSVPVVREPEATETSGSTAGSSEAAPSETTLTQEPEVSPELPQEPEVSPENTPLIFWATHKHAFGGCQGQIQLTKDEFAFVSSVHPLKVSRTDIRDILDDGIVDAHNKTWRFRLEGKQSTETKQILADWFNSQ